MTEDIQAPGGGLPDRYAPARIDVTAPSIARAHNYLLGGKDNYRVDQSVVDTAVLAAPDFPAVAAAHREFLARALRHLAGDLGIDQFLDIGAGLPAEPNTHDVVREFGEDIPVVYIDRDQVVVSHGRAMLAENATTAVVQADLLEPEGILAHPRVRAVLDMGRPVGVVLGWVVNFVSDDAAARSALAYLAAALAPGSCLIMSHLTEDAGGEGLDNVRRAARVLDGHYGGPRLRPSVEVADLLPGTEIMAPGVVSVSQWAAEGAADAAEFAKADPVWCFGAVARVR